MDRSILVQALRQGVETYNQLRKQHPADALDLSGGDFSGCDLRGALLGRMDLRGCNFSNADLTDANLSHSDLTGANLRGARIDNVNLHKAILTGADFQGVILRGFDRDGRMCLNVANFRGVKWGKAELETILDILNHNEEWEIRYHVVPRKPAPARRQRTSP